MLPSARLSRARPPPASRSLRLLQRDAPDVVRVGAEPQRSRLGIEAHVTDRAAHLDVREELLCLRVETHEALGLPGLRKPDAILVVLGERVRTRVRPARHRPLLHFAGSRVYASERA